MNLALRDKFLSLTNADDRYRYLIELGRNAPPYPPHLKTADRVVPGCQSILYLYADLREGKMKFITSSDALISQGLGALLVQLYNGESPETILQNPPSFLQEMGILASLSPNRSNGLASIYAKMQRECLKCLSVKALH